ncbi:selenide, water dikinase SelD [Olsenella massiliensis]|uniref:selenide, water dikinase SelD n=1 Tax=Olsenella massiliensis TaxID=1622075 RepID=UPI00071C2F39|nr:selenide, water dikinase SelD [Olsenella massiliensis]
MDDVRLTKLAECAGCGAKVGAGQLARLLEGLDVRHDPRLLVGFDKSDDAAVYQVSEDVAIVATTDFFPPIADDPYTYGAIAATNALSDVYAMGGEPKVALNILTVPQDMPKEVVHQILRGGYEKVYEAGAVIAGGHSIYDSEPKYGLAVTGIVDPRRLLTNAGARPGDLLVLTKALGVGVITTVAKAGLASPEDVERAERSMLTLNRYARDVMVRHDIHAATDVTGFGLMGHLLEMAQGADLDVTLDVCAVPLMPGVRDWARLGLLPAGMYRNRRYAQDQVQAEGLPLDLTDVLFSPETSGGLLLAVAPADASALVGELERDGRVPCARVIGRMEERSGGRRIRLTQGGERA